MKKIAILGVGLLGGSLAMALKKKKDIQLVGWSRRKSARQKASYVLKMVSRLEDAVDSAQIIVICTHSSHVVKILPMIANAADPDALILDVSSVKSEIIREASVYPWAPFHFVPCHPMAGKEKSGVEQADEKLYQGKVVFIAPLKSSPRKLIQKSVLFWKSVGGMPVIISAGQHDQFVALTSHLPHLLAALLTNIYGTYKKKNPLIETAIGSGFRDFTRIAAGNPSMWNDIFQMNRKEIKFFLGQYRKSFLKFEKELTKTKSSYWKPFFEKSKKIREQI